MGQDFFILFYHLKIRVPFSNENRNIKLVIILLLNDGMTQKEFENSKAVSTIVIIGLLLCLVIVVVVIGLNIAKTQEAYTETECKDVQVPYTASDCKDVQVPYSAQNCQAKTFVYNVVTTSCTQYVRGIFTPDPAKVVCTLNNLEQKPGAFVMTYGFLIAGQPVVNTDFLEYVCYGN